MAETFAGRNGQSKSNAKEYDLIVIGGGAAGLTAAAVASNLGAKTVMIESERLGGDCTWTGCVPSKALLRSAKAAHEVRTAGTYGISVDSMEVDFGKVMQRVRRLRDQIYEEDDHPRNFEAMGIEVLRGRARFIDPKVIEVHGEKAAQYLRGRYFVISAGGHPFIPPIEGLEDVPFYTSETLFDLEEQPDRLAVIGGGPIGTEMSQAFSRLGTDVTVFETQDRILPNDNEELARMLQDALAGEGVNYRCGVQVTRIVEQDDGSIRVETGEDGAVHEVEVDALLVATGRRPNLDALDLDAADIEYTERGITVNSRCRTNQRHIYASGDVTGQYHFTHMSEHMSKVAVTNALLKIPKAIDADHVPWVTYTDPELAHVGARERGLRKEGISFEVYRFPYEKVDRAVTDGETTGLIKVFAKSWNGRILGASILGAHAGELISEYAVAMRNGVTLRKLADTIHPYPSYGRAIRRAADQWYARKQSPTFTKILQTVFGYSGPVIEPDPERIV